MSIITQRLMLSSGLPASSVTYNGRTTTNAAQTTYNFTGESFGTATDTRVIAVLVGGSDNTTALVSSVTIGGVSATLAVRHPINSGSDPNTEIWYAVVPTGTTGTISVVFGGGKNKAYIACYSLYGLQSSTPVSTASSGGSSATDRTITLDTRPYGIAIAMATALNNTANFTWTNATSNFATNPASDDGFSGASTSTYGYSLDISVSMPAAITQTNLIGASWR